jgi:hypothetical protein
MSRRPPKLDLSLIGVVGIVGLILLALSPNKSPAPAVTDAKSTALQAIQQTPQPATASPSPAATPNSDEVRLYVRGHRVAIRDAPDSKASILDRVDNGLQVREVRREGDWVLIRHPITAKEGWIDARRLSIMPPTSGDESEREKPQKESPAKHALTVSAIARLLIQESIASYPGPCACPYQHDRRGHACGHRSAYSRPGGYAPLCYPNDISSSMVEAYRARSE